MNKACCTTSPIVKRLAAQRERWLAFLRPRLRDEAAAEDILQDSLVKAHNRGGSILKDENSIAWFYRLLRNTLIDHTRRQAARPESATDNLESLIPVNLAPEGEPATCQCFYKRLDYLKPRYAQLIRLIDLEQRSAGEVAVMLGERPSNLHVALHRARKALRRELERFCGDCASGGCLNCTCGDRPKDRE